jgi:hypothetical protein
MEPKERAKKGANLQVCFASHATPLTELESRRKMAGR